MPCTTDMTLCKKKMSFVQLFVCVRFEKKKKTRCKYDFDLESNIRDNLAI